MLQTLILGDLHERLMIISEVFVEFIKGILWLISFSVENLMEMQFDFVFSSPGICVCSEMLHPFSEQLLLMAAGCHIAVDLVTSGTLFAAHSRRDRC